ncbi:MAG: CoA transferase [Nitrospirae bacterium]|nr:CoA transferase [Nitrospirota bacterium]
MSGESLSEATQDLPLAGTRVVDISGSYAGPYCTMMLGDMGAEVIKVERPPAGDECRTWGPPFIPPPATSQEGRSSAVSCGGMKQGESAWFLSANRNKKSVLLNMKGAAGRPALLRLIGSADVFVENMRPAALERSGLTYNELSQGHPELIYCAITGFGMDGPLRDAPAYDLIGEGYGGIMSVSTEEGRRPLKVGTAVSDIVAGMFAAFAIASCLVRRRETGRGEFIDVSLLDGQIAFMAPRLAAYLVGDELQRCRGGSESPIAIYRSFRAKDGFVTLAVGNDEIWSRLCLALGRPQLRDDARFRTNADRKARQMELFEILESEFPARTKQEWISLLSEAGVPCGPVNSCEEVVAEPQVLARGALLDLEHDTLGRIRLAGVPWKLAQTMTPEPFGPPVLGEHTEEILAAHGFSAEEISEIGRECDGLSHDP